MHGGRLLSRALKAHGVRNLFGLCGDHINAIFEGCADEGIRIVDTRSELGAAHMAEGWSLATGEPGVVCVTGGPGLTNALTPMADALLAGTPMVVVTSNVRQEERGRGYPQDLDQMAFGRPLSVWATSVFNVERIPEETAQCFLQARVRRGPALLEVPLDVQLAHVDDSVAVAPVHFLKTLELRHPPEEAVRILAGAQRPIALMGEGAFWSGSGSSRSALRFIEKTGIPVFTIRAARGLIPDGHELCLGVPNFLRGAGQLAFQEADALLVVGCELDIVLAFGAIAPQAKMVRIEFTPDKLERHRRPDVGWVVDEDKGFAGLAHDVERSSDEGWLRALRGAAEEDARASAVEREAAGAPVHPARLAAEVGSALGERGTVAVDAGELALWALGALPATGSGRFLSSFSTPFATLGPGLPFAIAAKLARPDEPVIALVGDGAFGFTAMELDTAARHGVAVVVVVGNDAAWGIVKRQMEMGFGRSIAAELAPRRYDLLAQSLGASGERVEDADAVGPALGRALAASGPALVDVMLDRRPEHPAMKFIAAMFSPEH